jgi:Fungal Zn(2)-Cys(6) binuclear cluster domain
MSVPTHPQNGKSPHGRLDTSTGLLAQPHPYERQSPFEISSLASHGQRTGLDPSESKQSERAIFGMFPESHGLDLGPDAEAAWHSIEGGTPYAGGNDTNSVGHKDGINDKEDTPPWSDLKTKAGKERKRLPLACIACRRKKIRCSGEKPACKHCMRSRIPCVYRATTRKAVPRTDYMAMLEKRVKRMEERIIKMVPEENRASTVASGRAVIRPSTQAAVPNKDAAIKKRSAEDAFTSELDEWTSHPRQVPPTTGILPGLKQPNGYENDSLREGAESLPPKDIQEHLAEVYFDTVYGQAYHLLHKPSFMRRLRYVAIKS